MLNKILTWIWAIGCLNIISCHASEWEIGPTIVDFSGNNIDGVFNVDNSLGSDVDLAGVTLTLYDYDCVNQITGPSVIALLNEAASTNLFEYDISVTVGMINASDLTTFEPGWGASVGNINFCTSINTELTSLNIPVSWKRTNFQLHFNLTENLSFSLTVDAIEDVLEEIEGDVNATYSVDVCVCDPNFQCTSNSGTLGQNDPLGVCLSATGTNEVSVENFELRLTSENNYVYNPVSYGGNSFKPDSITTVIRDPTSRNLYVHMILVAGLFEGNAQSGQITLDGSAFLEFVNSGRKKTFVEFELPISVTPKAEKSGCLGKFLDGLTKFLGGGRMLRGPR